jgi:hypothetical protein
MHTKPNSTNIGSCTFKWADTNHTVMAVLAGVLGLLCNAQMWEAALRSSVERRFRLLSLCLCLSVSWSVCLSVYLVALCLSLSLCLSHLPLLPLSPPPPHCERFLPSKADAGPAGHARLPAPSSSRCLACTAATKTPSAPGPPCADWAPRYADWASHYAD